MAVAELFIGAFITVLFEKLASGDLIRLARSAGIYSELNKWSDTLTQIQAVLVDAGQKHIQNRPVQLWLNKLQHLAYEIDDVLDDLATEAMHHQLNQESDASTSSNTRKVLKFIPNKFRALKYGRKMGTKLDGITSKLEHLVKEKLFLGLNDNVERSNTASRRMEETSLVEESKIIGRQGDKEALLGKLLGSESSSSQTQNLNVLSIVGLGGIGKTTLAQLLYNDKKVKDHFELMSWVCVSDEFDVFNISKAIFKDAGGDDKKFETLNQLQVALTEKISKKRFLLVLDDVWNENYNEWELLQRPFTVGAPGSKILVTTRKTKVASVMDSVNAYLLELLSYEEALSLFALHALGKQNFDVNQTLKLHGGDIIKKCGRLPLALKTLGRVFRTKYDHEEWEELLNSEIWNSHESEILPALRLSYYDLPPHLKQIFAYCCLFPKDYLFDKDELVLLWMAEGFLYESNGIRSLESFGRKCFEELVSRSFFQFSSTNKSQYTMHDLINDLATSVGREFFFTLDDKMDIYNKHEALEKVHHLSFIREKYGAYQKFKALERARRLRTFLAMSVERLYIWETFYVPYKVLKELLPQLQFLRVLSLSNYKITKVPQSIGSLKHMRYLNFSNTAITCLPEQIGDLLNLQSLMLCGCHGLSTLPKSIVKLLNLRHLGITDTPKLKNMPSGLGGLFGLQTLSKVVIGGADKFSICDLKGLLYLEGQLSIEGMHNVKNSLHAREANLQQKKGICDLRMEWSYGVLGDHRNEINDFEVLEGLRPFEKLTSLKIVNYMGTKFPTWIGDPSFVCLNQLALHGCIKCTCLPTLGHLPSLQKLYVESMEGLKNLGSELLGPSNSCHSVVFPSLEILEFKEMKSWEEWSTSGGEKAISFPCLHEISIIDCPKLDVVAIDLIPSLRVLHVQGCSLAVLKSMVGVSSSISRLKICNIKGLTWLHSDVLDHIREVEDLEISKCVDLTYLWESEAATCKILVNLQKLLVRKCANLVSFAEKEMNPSTSMESLKKVRIECCPRLESYNCPSSIETLVMNNCYHCRSITSLGFPAMDGLPSALKNLEITRCGSLEASWLLNNFLSSLESLHISGIPSLRLFPEGCFVLESLHISNIPNLRLFPEGCFVHITKLSIWGCDNIESIPDNGYGFLPFLCLRQLCISNCKNLKSFPHEHLQSLTSLEEMDIYLCRNLDDSFPSGLWPPNLTTLKIGGLKKPISEWGEQKFPTSLVTLRLDGGENSYLHGLHGNESLRVGSLAKGQDIGNATSSSLTKLEICDFMELESLSEGLQHLTCLKELVISVCPKLRDLPETLLPSLSSLWVVDSSLKLRKKCSRNGKYWPIISQIPHFDINKE